jgi:hypothetical protein
MHEQDRATDGLRDQLVGTIVGRVQGKPGGDARRVVAADGVRVGHCRIVQHPCAQLGEEPVLEP